MSQKSQCEADTAPKLLIDILGLSNDEVNGLLRNGILVNHKNEGKNNSQNYKNSHDDNDIDFSSRTILKDEWMNVEDTISRGCWMRRRVDAMALIVVDALRFDFALDHLPLSVGAKLHEEKERSKNSHSSSTSSIRGQSQLFKFVADPPTVTMQRLKGLTTGGLPTFADISGSFGGAYVDEDSWLEQLVKVPQYKRNFGSASNGSGTYYGNDYKSQTGNTKSSTHDANLRRSAKVAFVGDDTWIDLFPTLFDDSHPYPSFNTRDLDTVDNGCFQHLPRLFRSFGSPSPKKDKYNNNNQMDTSDFFELIVMHFLGVDHVGHTYGPHNEHMDAKLHQIDTGLSNILSKIDQATDSCQVCFVFGDHGMTEDGNHGGGTLDETNAALFAHYSPGCGDLGPSLDITGSESGFMSMKAFQSINQIDLVPTISLLLGLPIPFANLGGLVPALLPPMHQIQSANSEQHPIVEAPFAAVGLALNSAQVWQYLNTYSNISNTLPADRLQDLKEILIDATTILKEALAHDNALDGLAYRRACGYFKYFLSEATDLGKQVWTRFDTFGMGLGIFILILALILAFPKWEVILYLSFLPIQIVMINIYNLIIGFLIIFQCVVIAFGNSYIESEGEIIQYILAITCITLSLQWYSTTISMGSRKSIRTNANMPLSLMILPLSSRLNILLVSGHGSDPMLRLHGAHNTIIFSSALLFLGYMRLKLNVWAGRFKIVMNMNTLMDLSALFCLGVSWYEKRIKDVERNGYLFSLFSIVICAAGLFALISQSCIEKIKGTNCGISCNNHPNFMLIKLVILVITVTGPSSASSTIFFVSQIWALSIISNQTGINKLSPVLVSALWRLVVKHSFFVTGHSCSFNRLQFSAAFVATETFYFYTAGISLFLNTFGWEIIGNLLLLNFSVCSNTYDVWSWFSFFQMLETLCSCISVTIMRRNLMVWAIFAPRFVFSSVFMIITAVTQIYFHVTNIKNISQIHINHQTHES